jgi:hypothetical protein
MFNCDYFQTVQLFQWLYLRGMASIVRYTYDAFQDVFLSARLDWVCLGVL